MRNLFSRTRDVIKVGIFIFVISIFIIILSSRALYLHTSRLLSDDLKERILAISITTAVNIDAKDINLLQNKNDWQKPAWSRVVNQLHKVKYNNDDIVFMYIFRKTKNDPKRMEFVADADSVDPFANSGSDTSKYIDVNRDGKIEPEGPDKLQWPGQQYPEASDIPEVFLAYDGPIVSKDLYTDSYGTVLTGYAPIMDEKGNAVAILATDIKADDFLKITNQVFRPFILFITFLITVITFLTIAIIFIWQKHVKFLTKIKRERSELVSVVTHHLGTPLTALKGYISFMKESLKSDSSESIKVEREMFDIIDKSTEDLVQVTRNFIDSDDLDENRVIYNFESVNIISLINTIANKFREYFTDKGVLFEEDFRVKNLLIKLDEEKFTKSLVSILNNSLKYTLEGKVRMETNLKNNNFIIKVTDTGIRNLPTTTKRLVSKFSQSKNQIEADIISKDLSLYIAKRTIESHGGKFTVRSYNSVTEFKIELAMKKGSGTFNSSKILNQKSS